MLHVFRKSQPSRKTWRQNLHDQIFQYYLLCNFFVILIFHFWYNCNTFVIILHVYWMTLIWIHILPFLIDSLHGTLTSRRVAPWRRLYFSAEKCMGNTNQSCSSLEKTCIFIKNYLLWRSICINFSYMFRPTESIFRENTFMKKYIFIWKVVVRMYKYIINTSSLARQSLVDPGLLEKFCPVISIEGGVLPSLNP